MHKAKSDTATRISTVWIFDLLDPKSNWTDPRDLLLPFELMWERATSGRSPSPPWSTSCFRIDEEAQAATSTHEQPATITCSLPAPASRIRWTRSAGSEPPCPECRDGGVKAAVVGQHRCNNQPIDPRGRKGRRAPEGVVQGSCAR